MRIETLNVELGDRSYPIHIGMDLLRDGRLLQSRLGDGPVAIVSNETVARLYLDRVRECLGRRVRTVHVIPDGEQFKTLETLSGIYDCLMRNGCDRQTALVALGGGVVGDITGFAAASFQRGVQLLQLPTTLLAQVDSSVGGKTGINHPLGKNMIGAFHQPCAVVIDIGTLDSLPQREFAAGMAEVIKYACIADADFLAWIEANRASIVARDQRALTHAIRSSCACKARIVAADEREGGIRALLNFGHTFGHAIETATEYSSYLHGEAVAIGMVMAACLSRRLDWISSAECDRIRELLLAFGLPVEAPRGLAVERFLALMAGDKKAVAGRPRLVLLRAVGEAVLSADYPESELRAVLADALSDRA